MNQNTNTNTFAEKALHALILSLFSLIQTIPTPALAFTQDLESHKTLVFPQHTEGTVLGVIATAYSSTIAQTDADPFTTASGAQVRPGTVAANFLPLGTILNIGGNTYTVEDRMNSRYNNQYRIDIWMESTEDARSFGTRPLTLEIVSVPTDR